MARKVSYQLNYTKKGDRKMIFTAIIYKSDNKKQKTAVTVIADSFEDAQKKLFSLYGKNLISIIYEIEKNFSEQIYEATHEKIKLKNSV